MIPALILFALGAYGFAKVGAYGVVSAVAHAEHDPEGSRRAATRMAKHLTLGVIAWALGICGIIWQASEMVAR